MRANFGRVVRLVESSQEGDLDDDQENPFDHTVG